MMRLILSAFLQLLVASSCMAANTINVGSIKVDNAWSPETPPGAQVMAGYMQIHNPSQLPVHIIAVSSPDVDKVEMHLSKEVDGIAKMLPQTQLTIDANGTLTLQPGSYHLMMIKPHKRFLQGDSITLTLTLSDKQQQNVTLLVKKNHSSPKRSMKCAAGKCGGGKCGGGR